MKNANISVTLPQTSLDYLDSVCEKKGLKRSQVVELLITAQKLAEEKGETLLPIYKVSMPDVNRTLTPEVIIQSLSQLKALYEKQWETVIDNCTSRNLKRRGTPLSL